jgi:branched-chain amino acid transport system ATP-binding protein
MTETARTTDLGENARGETLLSVKGTTVHFGGLPALSDVSVEVPDRSITGLVGPNGAGKSTLFGVISGLLKPDAGRVYMFGSDVTRATPQRRARLGLARTFQQPELFAGLTVREHLVLAYRVRHNRGRLWRDALTGGSLRRVDKSETARVDQLLDLLSLGDVSGQKAEVLPLGTGRLLEVGKALAASPSVVLLDEPLAGLDVHEAERLARALLLTVEKEGVSLLLVEHEVGMVLRLSSYIYVLDFGVLIAEGTPEVVRNHPDVRAAYLGDEDVAMARRDLSRTRPSDDE